MALIKACAGRGEGVPFENGTPIVAFFAFSGKTAKDFPLSNGSLPLGFY
jgi:hypothetical protein